MYSRATNVDPSPGGDSTKQAVLDVDQDLTGIFANLNTHEGLNTGVHGAGGSTVATAANIATHAAVQTGVHGVAITAGQTLTVTAGGTLGTAAYTAATAYDAAGTGNTEATDHVSTHAALQTGVHGVSITAGKTLTVTDNVTLGATNYASAAEVLAGAETAKAIAPATLVAARSADASFWGIKNLRLIEPNAAGDNTRVVVNPNAMSISLDVGGHYHLMTAAVDVDSVDDLDTGALAAGTDYYVYACTDGATLSLKVSANATVPTGFDAAHSRKIGGFHTLCTAVGAIGGHTLTNYAQKEILPASVWCLKHRAKNLVNVGMVYDPQIQKWVDIYLQSGTGTGTTSANGGTITDTRNWMDHADDGNAVGKRLPRDREFQSFAAGSNEETNISGSADPGTTGGHSDTAGRRMISNLGCEDCCGAMHQWLDDEAYIYSSGTGYWANLPGGKGSMYTNVAADPGAPEVDNADAGSSTKLVAGGNWNAAAYCGSRCRSAAYYRWHAHTYFGARFVSEPL
jgi:hypothetical protein